jgi:hypothetical protein
MSGFAYAASIVSSLATCIALIFAGLEFRRSRARDRHKRQVESEGVAVSLRPSEVPQGAQDARGRATWEYEFTAYNPGDLPISDVRVEIHFAIPVVRVRYERPPDEPTKIIVLEATPVLTGHGSRTWHRSLEMKYKEAQGALRQTKAVISFIDPEEAHKRHTNYWPKQLWSADEVEAAQADAQAALGPGHPSDRRR